MALPVSYNLRSLVLRWQVTLLSIAGVALAVAVVVVLLSLASGFAVALRASGRPDNAIVTLRGSQSEMTSGFSLEHAGIVASDARVARDARGTALASCEIVVVANLRRRGDGQPANVTLRGISPLGLQVRSAVELVRGRMFTPGLNEVVVGERIHERVQGLELGDRLRTQRQSWLVVGHFRAQSSAFESEIWGDRDVTAAAFNRPGQCNSLVVRLADPGSLASFDKDVQADPRLQVQMNSEVGYYEDQAGAVAGPLRALAVFVALVMGTGAVFGAMNTMYAVIAARTREIGTLRALGFRRRSIVATFVVESLLLALLGGLLGCLLTLPVNGLSSATGRTASFSEIAFAFHITSGDVLAGLFFALAMGLAGGVLPALRAARLPIVQALREV